jgi:cullin 1
MLQMIEKQRNGEMIDHNLIKITLDSYVTLGFEVSTKVDATLNIYKDHFQNDFLEQTKQYYSHHAKAYLSDHTIPEYVDHALKCIKEENDRLTSYLHISSTTPLIDVCHKELIKNYAPIIQEEFQTLLDNERRPDMSKVIQLLNMIPEGTNPLKIKFEQHVKTYGLQSIEQLVNSTQESVDSKDYIDCLLVTQKKFSQLVNEAFINDPGFIASLDKACSELVNRNKLTQKEGVTKSSELLARYCDAALRKGSKLTEETDLEQLLKDAMTIFRYIEDQDVFQKFYSKMLAKRLVNGTSSSEDGEINMLSKLKDSCGQEYTYKLTKMFNDIGSSKELNETFFNQVSNQDIKDSDIDFYTMVISFASWPLSSTATKFTLPPGLTTYYERFQRFYIHQHNGRKLNWLYHLCKGEIKAQYAHSKIPYTFIVSTYQMAILILFNDNDTISYESLCERTQLEEDIINGQLGILLKAKILLLNQGSKVGEANSVYKFNPDFKSKKIRVNLNLPVKSEVKQEAEETHQSINEDRKLYIQAAIVRVMKMRKTLLYVKLVQEVLAQISSHFKPQVVDIKKGIDILIEKEYIERDTEDKHTLKYLA